MGMGHCGEIDCLQACIVVLMSTDQCNGQVKVGQASMVQPLVRSVGTAEASVKPIDHDR
jgi:hypothetical protein